MYKYYGCISEQKELVHHPKQLRVTISLPQSLQLEAACPRIKDVVRNWCKVRFTET